MQNADVSYVKLRLFADVQNSWCVDQAKACLTSPGGNSIVREIQCKQYIYLSYRYLPTDRLLVRLLIPLAIVLAASCLLKLEPWATPVLS